MSISEKFYLQYADPSDFADVVRFYAEDEQRRTKGVYLRNESIIKSQISRGLFLTVRNEDKNIVAASALYLLNKGKAVDCVARNNGSVVEQGRVAELGSVLRMGRGVNDIGVPTGFWNNILFGVPMLMAFDKANTDLPIDILVADVQINLTNTINNITGAASTRSPLRWELFTPATGLVQAFKSTTDSRDKNVDRPKNFYRASVQNLPDVAKSLLEWSNRGYVTNHLNQQIEIDLSALGLTEMMKAIVDKSWYFTDRLVHHTSWSEARRTFHALTPCDLPRTGAPSVPNPTSYPDNGVARAACG